MPHIRFFQHHSDWEYFIALELSTSRASIEDASPEVAQAFAQHWPDKIKSMYEWSEQGPTTQGSVIFVLETDDNNYAGHVWIMDQDDFFSGEKTLFVTALAIAPKYRGRGWGRLLMNRVAEEAAARKLKKIRLGVEASNTGATALYESLGYQTKRLTMECCLTSL